MADRVPADPAERQRKIAAIRRTGRTHQWPDLYRHRQWTTAHKVAFCCFLLFLAAVIWSVT